MLDEIMRKGLEPDMITNTAVISACEKSQYPTTPLALLEEMRRTGLEHSVITYRAVISS